MSVGLRDRLAGVVYPLTRGLNALVCRVLLSAGERRTLRGIDTRLIALGGSEQSLVRKLESALVVLESNDPVRWERFKAAIRVVGIVRSGKTQYVPQLSAVMIRASFLDQLQPDHFASVLVHEETHARLERLGVRYTPCAKPRIERVCVRNQMWFLRRVPGAEALVGNFLKDLWEMR